MSKKTTQTTTQTTTPDMAGEAIALALDARLDEKGAGYVIIYQNLEKGRAL